MAKIGKISIIPKDFSTAFPTQEASLRSHGFSRFPGTGRVFFPYKELDGKYRTGLDENASYIKNIPSSDIREAERKRVKELRTELEEKLGISLSPTSLFYKFSATKLETPICTSGIKLADGDKIFNLDDPISAVEFAWLRVHPGIAPSYEAYLAGQVPFETQYFVNDDDYENQAIYNKNKTLNEAIGKLDVLSLERRKKVARLMDLPITEDTKEAVVYNSLNNLIKLQEIPSGVHKGQNPIRIFNMYVDLEDNTLDVRDLVGQAFKHQIYREKKGGKVYEGEQLVWDSKEELIEHLLDDANQMDRLSIEKKLKMKQIAAT